MSKLGVSQKCLVEEKRETATIDLNRDDTGKLPIKVNALSMNNDVHIVVR